MRRWNVSEIVCTLIGVGAGVAFVAALAQGTSAEANLCDETRLVPVIEDGEGAPARCGNARFAGMVNLLRFGSPHDIGS